MSGAATEPSVFLCHGAGAEAGSVTKLARILTAKHGVAAVPLSYPGRADVPGPARATVSELAAFVRERVVAQLGSLTAPHVVLGHSMGGAVALEYALDAPAGLRALVLVSTGARLRVHPSILAAFAPVEERTAPRSSDEEAFLRSIEPSPLTPPAPLEVLFAAVIAVFLIYVVMASSFESLHHPLLIMGTVPLALIGVAAACVVTGTPISAMVGIGAIILGGIVVNNAIVLVNTVNFGRGQGMSVDEALINAGRLRLRPIVMTTATTVARRMVATAARSPITIRILTPARRVAKPAAAARARPKRIISKLTSH